MTNLFNNFDKSRAHLVHVQVHHRDPPAPPALVPPGRHRQVVQQAVPRAVRPPGVVGAAGGAAAEAGLQGHLGGQEGAANLVANPGGINKYQQCTTICTNSLVNRTFHTLNLKKRKMKEWSELLRCLFDYRLAIPCVHWNPVLLCSSAVVSPAKKRRTYSGS